MQADIIYFHFRGHRVDRGARLPCKFQGFFQTLALVTVAVGDENYLIVPAGVLHNGIAQSCALTCKLHNVGRCVRCQRLIEFCHGSLLEKLHA